MEKSKFDRFSTKMASINNFQFRQKPKRIVSVCCQDYRAEHFLYDLIVGYFVQLILICKSFQENTGCLKMNAFLRNFVGTQFEICSWTWDRLGYSRKSPFNWASSEKKISFEIQKRRRFCNVYWAATVRLRRIKSVWRDWLVKFSTSDNV